MSRRELVPIKVYVTNEERTTIRLHAKNCGQTASTFLRELGLGYVPPSRLDARLIYSMLVVCRDLGRLGRLQKLYLSNKAKYNSLEQRSAGRLQEDISDTVAKLSDLIIDAQKGLRQKKSENLRNSSKSEDKQLEVAEEGDNENE